MNDETGYRLEDLLFTRCRFCGAQVIRTPAQTHQHDAGDYFCSRRCQGRLRTLRKRRAITREDNGRRDGSDTEPGC